MKFIFSTSLLLTVLFCTENTQAQNYEDSLRQVIRLEQNHFALQEATFLLGEYLVQLNPEEAERLAVSLESMINLESDSSEWTRYTYILAASHRWQGNYKTALDLYADNYSFFKSKNDQVQVAKSGRFIGLLNMYLGNNVRSQVHLLECAEIYSRLGTAEQQAGIENLLASFYLNIDQTDKALSSYQKALEQFTLINDSAGMSSCNANLGLLYTELGELDKAEAHLLKEKDLNKVFPTLREMGFHHDFMGVLRQAQGRTQEAYEEHLIGLRIREGLSSTYNLCESKINIGDVLIQLERYDEAIGHLTEVLGFEEHESHYQEINAQELLATAYEKKGQYRESLAHFKEFKKVNDRVVDENSIQVIAEKDAHYQKDAQDAEILILNKENELTQERLTKTRVLVYLSGLAFLVISVLSFLIYRMYDKIKGQNTIIVKALKDKNLLIHEIHHRVKNNLQIISSLLSLQSRYISDQTALNAIKDGRNRVQSMAIIHKNLYREDDITGVGMQTYFRNLIEGIFSSYNLSKEQIKLKLDIDDLRLDIDTVIPIGLITNELITNSLRYAFTDLDENALVEVKLKELKGELELIVSDNGVGISDSIILAPSDQTFGQRMIKAFVEKLKANMHISNEHGTQVVINIPRAAVAA